MIHLRQLINQDSEIHIAQNHPLVQWISEFLTDKQTKKSAFINQFKISLFIYIININDSKTVNCYLSKNIMVIVIESSL